jgi:rhodanese-related sulfurtransferase
MSEFASRWQELPRDRPLLVMCASGGRSAAATAFLVRNGYEDVANVAGGIVDWERAGLPVRKGPPEPGEGTL